MSSTQIKVEDLLQQFSEVLAQANPGDEIIVMEGEIPRAKLIPLPPRSATKLGLHPGAFQMTEDFDDPLPEEFWLGKS